MDDMLYIIGQDSKVLCTKTTSSSHTTLEKKKKIGCFSLVCFHLEQHYFLEKLLCTNCERKLRGLNPLG